VWSALSGASAQAVPTVKAGTRKDIVNKITVFRKVKKKAMKTKWKRC